MKAKQFACYLIQLHRCFVIKIQLNFRWNIHTIHTHTHTSIHRQYHYFLHLLVIKCILTKSKMCALFVCQLGYEYNLIKRRKNKHHRLFLLHFINDKKRKSEAKCCRCYVLEVICTYNEWRDCNSNMALVAHLIMIKTQCNSQTLKFWSYVC